MQLPKSAVNLSPLKQRMQLLEEAEQDFARFDREQAMLKNAFLKTLDAGAARLIYLTEISTQRKLLADSFSATLDQLADYLLKQPAAAEKFFSALDQLRKMGIAVMRERYGNGSNYHQEFHAVQVAYDTMRELEKNLGAVKNAYDRMLQLIMLGLAGAAAAWHDVEQRKKIRTHNEVASANEFCDQFAILFNSQDDMIADFLNYRELMSEELIVDGTFLDYQKDAQGNINAKPVGMRIDADIFVAKKGVPVTPFQMLLLAKQSIALVDASSAAARHVLDEQVIYHSLDQDQQATINRFLAMPEIKELNVNPESFLQSIGQSMRMLLESSLQPKGKDLEQYIDAILSNRNGKNGKKTSPAFYSDCLKHFLQDEKVLDAEDKFSVYMSDGETESLWQEQRVVLSALQKYMQRISQEEREKLAKTLFVSVAHERGTHQVLQAIVNGDTLLTLYRDKNQTLAGLSQ